MNAPARLAWRLSLAHDWAAFTVTPQQLAAGGVTPGWLPLVVDYGLLAPVPAPGEYRGVVTYTLTQP